MVEPAKFTFFMESSWPKLCPVKFSVMPLRFAPSQIVFSALPKESALQDVIPRAGKSMPERLLPSFNFSLPDVHPLTPVGFFSVSNRALNVTTTPSSIR